MGKRAFADVTSEVGCGCSCHGEGKGKRAFADIVWEGGPCFRCCMRHGMTVAHVVGGCCSLGPCCTRHGSTCTCDQVMTILQDLKNMDADVIFSKQLKQIEKEKRDKETKLKTQEKKVSSYLSQDSGRGARTLLASFTGGLL